MSGNKRRALMEEIEDHLRMTARQLLKFDTEEEVLRYLADAFQSRLNCDLVGVITKEGDYFIPKVWNGDSTFLKKKFPLKVEQCPPKLLEQSLSFTDPFDESLSFLDDVDIKTGFTFPIQDEHANYGFGIVGYLDEIPLFNMNQTFDQFGRDAAAALVHTRQKEQERRKMMGIEFVSRHLSLDTSMDHLVEKIVGLVGKGTKATFAGIYLYDEAKNQFKFQPPSYGKLWKPEKIPLQKNAVLKDNFPFLEEKGGAELTVPLTIDVKMIGVLHLEKKTGSVFTYADLDMLSVMAEHVSSLLQNAYLYQQSHERMERLQELLDYQQILTKKTINEDDFSGITEIVSENFQQSVILLDRFMRPIVQQGIKLNSDGDDLQHVWAQLENRKKSPYPISVSIMDAWGEVRDFMIWPVQGGKDLLGYLVVEGAQEEMDTFERLALELSRNTYSVQFIKQRLVMEAKEQVKDSFIERLMVDAIEDKETIIEYANLFNWDIFKPHRVAVLDLALEDEAWHENDILGQQARKTAIFDELKSKLASYDSDILFAKKDDVYVLIVPEDKEGTDERKYWAQLADKLQKWLQQSTIRSRGTCSIGGVAYHPDDYYTCYRQAMQALHVLTHQSAPQSYAFFDDLGSYTILHLIKDTAEAQDFKQNYLKKLLDYSNANQMDLFQTLRAYLEQNGNLKKTSEHLFIHRSTLLYRLGRIKEILNIDIDHAETRFNLMMTYKLYDLGE